MLEVKTGIRAAEVRLDGEHTLFVEGDEQSFDPKVLQELFNEFDGLVIKPLGSSFYVKSVAQALIKYYPKYYFLIDRDHHEDDVFVEECWDNFPNPEQYNLLVWRKKEIENYFLEPSYLSSSKYFQGDKVDLEERIRLLANERLFLDVVNYVIVSIRERQKENWIAKFTNPAEFPSQDIALSKLKSTPAFRQRSDDVADQISDVEIEKKFHDYLVKMTGGETSLSFGTGNWLSMVDGKKILSQIVNSCFSISDKNGASLGIKEKLHVIVKDLLRKDQKYLPEDFVDLRDLITKKIQSSWHR